MIKKALLLSCLCSSAFASPVGSQASTLSQELSAQGMGQVVQGSSQLLQAGSLLPITALETIGNITYVTLKAAEASTTVTIQVAKNVTGGVLLGAGQVVQVIGTGSGTLLTTSGRVLAYIPNQAGKALLKSQPLT